MFTTFLTAFMIIFIKSRLIGVILLIIALINTVTYFVPSEYFSPDDDYYMKRFFANRVISGEADESPEYKNYSEDFLLLPVWVTERPSGLPNAKIESDSADISSLVQVSPYEYIAGITSEGDSEIKINNYYYPGWSVYVDGQKTEIYPLEPHGNIGLNISQGEHNLKVVWEETPNRKSANYISLFSLVLALSMVFVSPAIFKRS